MVSYNIYKGNTLYLGQCDSYRFMSFKTSIQLDLATLILLFLTQTIAVISDLILSASNLCHLLSTASYFFWCSEIPYWNKKKTYNKIKMMQLLWLKCVCVWERKRETESAGASAVLLASPPAPGRLPAPLRVCAAPTTAFALAAQSQHHDSFMINHEVHWKQFNNNRSNNCCGKFSLQ